MTQPPFDCGNRLAPKQIGERRRQRHEADRVALGKRGETEVTRLLGGISPSQIAAMKSHAASGAGTARPIPEAVSAALEMTARQSYNFIRIAGCNSCHSQDLPSAAAGFVRSRGLPAPKEVPQLPPSMMPSPERLIAALKERIAGFKVPKRVIVMTELPRNAMGKVQKKLLREQHTGLFNP